MGRRLRATGVPISLIFTSVLDRATETAKLIADASGRSNTGILRDWRLNERHYGALTGQLKAEISEVYGAERTLLWRRGFAACPPDIDENGQKSLISGVAQWGVDPTLLPMSESLADTQTRVLEFWRERIYPALSTPSNPVVVAHGNSLRVLIAWLENHNLDALDEIEVPNCELMSLQFDRDLRLMYRFNV